MPYSPHGQAERITSKHGHPGHEPCSFLAYTHDELPEVTPLQ